MIVLPLLNASLRGSPTDDAPCFETITDLTSEEEERLSSWLENLCKTGIDGIVVSDYGKGVCTPTCLKKSLV